MADSVVYASLFACVLARLPALRTTLVAFDTRSPTSRRCSHDPVDVLFGVQLGGGTDIASALGYCQRLITRPADTVLRPGQRPVRGRRRRRCCGPGSPSWSASGVTVVVLLALSDEGAPAHDHAPGRRRSPRSARPSSPARPTEFPDLLGSVLAHRGVPGPIP